MSDGNLLETFVESIKKFTVINLTIIFCGLRFRGSQLIPGHHHVEQIAIDADDLASRHRGGA